MHGHSSERICAKFGTWHFYTLQMVTRVSERCSSPWVRAQHARIGRRNGSSAVGALAPSGNSELAASNCNGSSPVGTMVEQRTLVHTLARHDLRHDGQLD